MGTVYRAVDVDKSEFAIKVLNRAVAKDVEAVARFKTEAETAMTVHHPNVIEVYEFGESAGGIYYLVMELLNGPPLSKEVRSRPLLPKRAVAITGQVVAGLGVMHDANLIHRDLKPDNIILHRDGDAAPRVKLFDFGLAKPKEGRKSGFQTTPGLVVGTAMYMSPEQAMGRLVDVRSDIYTLGICLYEMLVGFPPFNHTNAFELMTQHVSERPRPINEICPRPIPRELSALIDSCLEKNPNDRPQSASEVRAELVKVMNALKAA